MTTLSVDEIRVLAVDLDAAVPSLLDQYAHADLAADAAARRGLVARGLRQGDRVDPVVSALFRPLTAPREVLEVETLDHRVAQVTNSAGGVTALVEVAPDVWDVVAGTAAADHLDATLIRLVEQPAAPGTAVSLTVDDHVALLGLLDSPAAVEGFLVHHLGDDGRRLADAFGPAATAGRVIRTVRSGDVVTVARTGWLAGPGGVWRVDAGDPDDVDARTVFVPCSGAEVAHAVAAVRTDAAAVAAA